MEHPIDVDPQDAVELLGGGVQKRLGQPETRVVHHDVDPTELLSEIDSGLDLGGIGDVALHEVGLGTKLRTNSMVSLPPSRGSGAMLASITTAAPCRARLSRSPVHCRWRRP